MKKLFLVLLILPFLTHAQTITFEVKDGAGDVVRILKPVDGKYFWANNSIDTLDANGKAVLTTSDRHPGIYLYSYKGRAYRLYVRPGDEVRVFVNQQDTISPFVISGAQADGQIAFNQVESTFYQDKGDSLLQEYPLFEDAEEAIAKQIGESLAPFIELQGSGKIDDGFYHAAQASIKNYYASVLTVSLFDDIQQLVRTADSARHHNVGKIDTLLRRWDGILKIVEVNDASQAISPTFIEFHSLYDSWYLAVFDPQSRDFRYHRSSSEDDSWKAPYGRIKDAFDGDLREYLLASRIHYINAQQRFQGFQLDLFDDFTAHYPNSVYTAYLAPGIEAVVAYQDKINADFDSTHQFVNNYGSINTFDELAKQFKGKVVYVDLWATWCGPCKAEFAHNEGLKAFTEEKGIEVLYVSTDRDEAEQQWEDMIKFYNLTGHHVRASKSLFDDLRKHFSQDFGGQTGFAIPYYIILKDGEVVVKNALRPSAKQELYKQLEDYL